MRGTTRLIMFKSNMNAINYGRIVEAGLVPFIRTVYSDGHQLQQVNDPKHRSNHIKRLFKFHDIYWWKTPIETPNRNPVENCWDSLKQYLRTTYKPTNTEELMNGFEEFWNSLTPEVCIKYIRHLHRVIPKVIAVDGNPSGY